MKTKISTSSCLRNPLTNQKLPILAILIAFFSITTLTAQDTLPAPRCEFASAYLNGSWYIFGGLVHSTPSKSSKSMEEPCNNVFVFYDSSNMWVNMAASQTISSRYSHKIIASNGKLYTFGGQGTDPDNYLRDTWVYDTVAKAWTNKTATATGDFPGNVASYGLSVHNNLMYLHGGHSRYNSGGYHVDEVTNYLYSYNPATNHWQLYYHR
jgi:N-acetylneuraminic acid mutarotase